MSKEEIKENIEEISEKKKKLIEKTKKLSDEFNDHKKFNKKLEEEVERIEREKKEHLEKIESEKEEYINFHKAEIIFENKKKHKIIVAKTVILISALLALLFLSYSYFHNIEKQDLKEESIIKLKKIEKEKDFFKKVLKEESAKKGKINASGEYGLEAKAFGIFVIKNDSDEIKEIFSKNIEKKVSLASITKLMTAIVALESDEKDIEISQKSLSEFGDSGLLMGEKFKIKDIVTLMLSVSSNDGARAISESYDKTLKSRENFIAKMNKKADELGMKETIFFSESGLDVAQKVGGAYSSISDLKKMVYYFYKNYPEISKRITRSSDIVFSNTNKHNIRNTNILLKNDNNFLLSKTGYTDLTGGNLVTIYNLGDNNKAIILILNSTKKGRFSDTEVVIEALKKVIK